MALPFSTATNPNLLYLTDSLHGTLEKIRFAIQERQGLSLIMSDVGFGKTTVLRYLHAEYADFSTPVITTMVSTGSFPSPYAMLRRICESFGIPAKRSQQKQYEALESWLMEQYLKEITVIVFMDEAQSLSYPMLELVRTMLNFESHDHKLLQLVLCGSLDLRDRIMSKRSRAIRSRVFAPCTLNALGLNETRDMIQFRCDRSGFDNPFQDEAVVQQIYKLTAGVPRHILMVCNHALNMARRLRQPKVPVALIEAAYQESLIVKVPEVQLAEAV